MVRQRADNVRSLNDSKTRRFSRRKRASVLSVDHHVIQEEKPVAAARGGKGGQGALFLFCGSEPSVAAIADKEDAVHAARLPSEKDLAG